MHLSSSLQSTVQDKLSKKFSTPGKIHFTAIGGGSINNTYRISFGNQLFFCKVNSASKFPQLFSKEKNGLALIGKQDIIKVPSVVACFENNDKQVLLLEWIQEGERTETFWKNFGEQLAALHQQTARQFGWTENNYMGSVPQSNTSHSAWATFFLEERLQPMVFNCFEKHQLTKTHLQQFENLYTKVEDLFENEKPSLVHGDLWSGNFMCNTNGEPVLIDPAVYYGHRSIDLAMTTLFSSFRQPFYEAYHYHFPLPSNYEEQWAVCNLYPLLIHLYLFGSGYLSQIERTLNTFG